MWLRVGLLGSRHGGWSFSKSHLRRISSMYSTHTRNPNFLFRYQLSSFHWISAVPVGVHMMVVMIAGRTDGPEEQWSSELFSLFPRNLILLFTCDHEFSVSLLLKWTSPSCVTASPLFTSGCRFFYPWLTISLIVYVEIYPSEIFSSLSFHIYSLSSHWNFVR